jgi:DNA uptake protein ComE-like DNA-binding protein
MKISHPTLARRTDIPAQGPDADRGFSGPSPRRNAFVLVAVLIVVMLASMVALSLLFRVRAEETATNAGAGMEQAWATALSGVREAMRVARAAAEGEPSAPDWEDNPRAFRDQLVFDDGADRWYFSVYSAALEETAIEPRFGLTDEAAKVNINHSHQAGLEKLPAMTPALAQAARDYVDADNLERPDGAEQEYYSGLAWPYAMRNGPLDTLDELLLVRGFTPRLLYGEDANMNFRLDPNEDDGEERAPADNKDGRLDLGLRRFLTVFSYEYDNDHNGVPRTNVNNPRAALPGLELPGALTNYIALLRAAHGRIEHVADLLEATGKFKDKSGKEVDVPTGVGLEELPLVLDLFSATDDAQVAGLVNVNTASAAVLQTIPGIDDALADSIVAARRNLIAERRQSIAWLYQEKVVDLAQFKQIAPQITARSFQYSFRVVGYGLPSGRYCVLDVVIDLARTEPAVVLLRDITRRGLPFAVGVNPTQVAGHTPATRPPISVRVPPASSRGAAHSATRLPARRTKHLAHG